MRPDRPTPHPNHTRTKSRLSNLIAIGILVAPALALADKPQGPCPFFDEAVTRKIFPASANEPQLERRDRRIQTCAYIWSTKPQDRNAKGRLTLAKTDVRVEAKDWPRVLNGYGNLPLTPVPELGPHAVWSDQRSQLSMIAKGHIFHVTIEDGSPPEANKTRPWRWRPS
ncbi:MAG: hypothetical protein R3E56_14705 [Burkholderiaceae bacterium]